MPLEHNTSTPSQVGASVGPGGGGENEDAVGAGQEQSAAQGGLPLSAVRRIIMSDKEVGTFDFFCVDMLRAGSPCKTGAFVKSYFMTGENILHDHHNLSLVGRVSKDAAVLIGAAAEVFLDLLAEGCGAAARNARPKRRTIKVGKWHQDS
eukprot:1160858-Pelagomonas_calceolata.AAC.9